MSVVAHAAHCTLHTFCSWVVCANCANGEEYIYIYICSVDSERRYTWIALDFNGVLMWNTHTKCMRLILFAPMRCCSWARAQTRPNTHIYDAFCFFFSVFRMNVVVVIINCLEAFPNFARAHTHRERDGSHRKTATDGNGENVDQEDLYV